MTNTEICGTATLPSRPPGTPSKRSCERSMPGADDRIWNCRPLDTTVLLAAPKLNAASSGTPSAPLPAEKLAVGSRSTPAALSASTGPAHSARLKPASSTGFVIIIGVPCLASFGPGQRPSLRGPCRGTFPVNEGQKCEKRPKALFRQAESAGSGRLATACAQANGTQTCQHQGIGLGFRHGRDRVVGADEAVAGDLGVAAQAARGVDDVVAGRDVGEGEARSRRVGVADQRTDGGVRERDLLP